MALYSAGHLGTGIRLVHRTLNTARDIGSRRFPAGAPIAAARVRTSRRGAARQAGAAVRLAPLHARHVTARAARRPAYSGPALGASGPADLAGHNASPLRAWIRGHPPRMGRSRLATASRIPVWIRSPPARAGIRLHRTPRRPAGTVSFIGARVRRVPARAGTPRRVAASRACCPGRPIGTWRVADGEPGRADDADLAARELRRRWPRPRPALGPGQHDNDADGRGPARIRAGRSTLAGRPLKHLAAGQTGRREQQPRGGPPPAAQQPPPAGQPRLPGRTRRRRPSSRAHRGPSRQRCRTCAPGRPTGCSDSRS